MFTIYRRLWQVNWAEQWQYRANLIMYLLYWLVSPIVHLAVWTSIAKANGDVNGLTANDFVTYYMLLLIVDQLTSNITIHIFAYKVQDGSLSGELVKPIHPMLTNTLVNNIAFKAIMLMGFLPVWGILARSHQDPGLFLGMELRMAPVPAWAVDLAGAAAVLAVGWWGASRLAMWARGRLPVAHTRVVYAEDGSDAGAFARKAPGLLKLTEASPLSQIVPDLAPAPGEFEGSRRFESLDEARAGAAA